MLLAAVVEVAAPVFMKTLTQSFFNRYSFSPLTALGEGPLYRINPNGPQDIEISENSINDLLNIDGDGGENTDFFKTLSRTGTVTQSVLTKFGQQTVAPQQFSSPVTLKKGNIDGIPQARVFLQETSARAWDEINIHSYGSSSTKTRDKAM